MKKLFIILSLFLFPNYALAATYFVGDDNYYYTEDYSDDFVSEEIRYKFYSESKVYSDDYYIDGENEKEFSIKSDKFILTDPSDYSKDYPIDKPNRIINSKKIYKYGSLDKIRYLNFYDISGSDKVLRFYELNIFNKNEKLNYYIKCDTCSVEFNNRINNDIYEEEYVTANNNFIIDLGNYYSISDLKVSIYLTDPIGNSNSTIKLKVGKDLDNYLDYINPSIDVNMNNTFSNYYIYNIKLSDYISEKVYVDVFETEEEKENYILIDSYDVYSYQDKKYLYYKIDKIYLDDYYVEKKGYIKDEKLYKVYYKKQNKLKIDIDDNFTINSYEYDIKNIITNSEIDKNSIDINNDIDINKNGVYKVLLKYNDFEIEKYVTVDIKRLNDEIVENKNNNVESISLVKHHEKIETNKENNNTSKEKDNKESVDENINIKYSYLSLSMIGIFTLISFIYYKNCHKLSVKDND